MSETTTYSRSRPLTSSLSAHISWCASIVRRCIALVSSDALQVDIYVTKVPENKPMASTGTDAVKPPRISWMPSKDPLTMNTVGASSMEDVALDSHSRVGVHVVDPSESSFDDHNSLLMPNPYDGMSGARYGEGGLQGTDYDYEMGVGHSRQDTSYDVLDDTHFNGDLDEEVNPTEESFNRRLRQEGVLRRKMTKKMTMAQQPNQEHLWADLGQQIGSPALTLVPTPGEFPSPPGSSDGHDDVSKAKRDYTDPKVKSLSRPSMSSMRSVNSIREKISDVPAVQALLRETGKGARGEEVSLHFTDEEVEDMLAMTEFAWPGRPMLGKLLEEEVNRANGSIVVACEYSALFTTCFPHSDPISIQVAARLS